MGVGSVLSCNAYAESLPKAKITELVGEVRYKNPSDIDWKQAEKNTELLEGARVFVGPEADCQIAFGNNFKSVSRLKQDTQVVLASMGDEPRVEIVSGEMFTLVRNLDKKSTFKVVTPTAVASVRGTAFSFATDGIGAEMNSTLQVYEHTVGLSPVDKPEDESAVDEGHGAVMGFDGKIEKEFELSPEDIRAGTQFVTEAVNVMGQDKPETVDTSQSGVDSDSKESKEEDKAPVGPTPPGPPSGDPPNGPGSDGAGSNNFSPLKDTGYADSAMDGILMGMARDSELSHSESFGGATLQQMFSSLSDLNYGVPMSENMDPATYAEMVRNAIEQSSYFQNQPPDVQNNILAAIGGFSTDYFENTQNDTSSEAGPVGDGTTYSNEQTSYTGSDGTSDTFGDGTNSYGDSSSPGPTDYVDQSNLANDITSGNTTPPPPPFTNIDFSSRIQMDYSMYKISNGGSDAGYYGATRTITNFSFTKNDVGYLGSIVFTPVDADPSPATGTHDHAGPDFLHINDLIVKDDPTGVSGNVIDTTTATEVQVV
jgi:hypothetical protein